MLIDGSKNNDQILVELGHRLARQRKKQSFTKANLAERAGVSKRTVERMESGLSIQMSTLLQVLRILSLLGRLEKTIPGELQASKKTSATPKRVLRESSNEEDQLRKSRSWGFGQ